LTLSGGSASAGSPQGSGDFWPRAGDGRLERPGSGGVRGIRIRARGKQRIHRLLLGVKHCEHEGATTVRIAGIDIDALRKERV